MDLVDLVKLNIIPVSIITAMPIAFVLYRNFRRYTHYIQLPMKEFAFKGIVTRVGDGDGFKVVHVPFLRTNNTKNVQTLSIRLAGIDAPEVRCFGKPEQPFAQEAKQKLTDLVLGKKVYVKALKLDLHNRILAIVYVRTGVFSWINVNLEMLKSGLACVFESTYTSFGGMEVDFRKVERQAKSLKSGMWKDPNVVLPMEHKSKHRR